MKTFHLLRTVPALDQCQIRFSTCGNVIYATNPQRDDDVDDMPNSITTQYGSSFRYFAYVGARGLSRAILKFEETILLSVTLYYLQHLRCIDVRKHRHDRREETNCRFVHRSHRRLPGHHREPAEPRELQRGERLPSLRSRPGKGSGGGA